MNSFATMIAGILLSSISSLAWAGSVGGRETSRSSNFSSCDVRNRSFECTSETKKKILDGCYVILHKEKLTHCTWQSCEHFSLVGEKPTFKFDSGSTVSGTLNEYGVNSSANRAFDWECDTNNRCLPKFPFSRHYMTLRQALDIRRGNDTSEIARTLKSIPQYIIDANPYARCASAEDATVLVRIKNYGSGYPGLMTNSSKQDEVCSTLRKFVGSFDDPNLECHMGGDKDYNGSTLIQKWK